MYFNDSDLRDIFDRGLASTDIEKIDEKYQF